MRVSLFFAIFLTLPCSARAESPSLLPESFLRRWDPVTFFFPQPVGKKSGPEDSPEKFAKISPAHPGAFSWIDEKTLVFKPVEPWPALARFEFTVRGKTFRRSTLMSAPLNLSPADGETGLEAVQTLSLTFPEPLPPEALAKMVRVELRPLPGAGDKEVRVLRREELEVKVMDRPTRSEPASYVLAFKGAIPLGLRATVRFQLSLDDQAEESFFETSFSTAEQFRLVSFGCRGRRYPVTRAGSKYQEDQAIRCSSESRTIEVELSTEPGPLDILQARNMVRVSPHVEELSLSTSGRMLYLTGDFAFDQTYKISLHPVPLNDARGRVLQPGKISELYLYYPKRPSFLEVSSAQGVLERFGPKSIPLSGRGFTRIDLRIYPIDPYNLDFWPFDAAPVSADESARPPGPGEEPEPRKSLMHPPRPEELVQHVSMLGPPPLSRIVELPLKKTKSAASFGLDLTEYLAALSGKNSSGHYLLGLRRLDGSNERTWMRVQVTDLSLTTLEGRHGEARVLVTRLSNGLPVPRATVKLEGQRKDFVGVLHTIETDKDGFGSWRPSSGESVVRISAVHEKDYLVLDANRPPNRYVANYWMSSEENGGSNWLQGHYGVDRSRDARVLCHLYSERPVYRPNEQVHFGGWVRTRVEGRIENNFAGRAGFELAVTGPGNAEFVQAVELGELGGFHREFSEKDLPTGEYRAVLRSRANALPLEPCGLSFRVEAYRIPTFEIRLHGATEAPMDRELPIKLTASYYAGGPVSDRPVRWRVTQFPYTWSPPAPLAGFHYSTDARWSGRMRFDAGEASTKEGTTDESGAAILTLNPAIEPTAQPRAYVVEATVTGDDEQTVTATHRSYAVPAFVLGLKVPRFLEHASAIEPEIVAVAPKGGLIEGTEVTVRLIHRSWHSHLVAGDFTRGAAKYVTDVVEKKIYEQKLTTRASPIKTSLSIPEAGVYIVELEARDKLGRAQVVAVDLYAGGEKPMAWKKPSNGVFAVKSDRQSYQPGDTATFVLESPYLSARALAVVETPSGNEYSWLDVRGGTATFQLKMERRFVPRIPVHFVLMRGRVDQTNIQDGETVDLGKPSTLASTIFPAVEATENKLSLVLKYPKKSRPGDEITVELELRKYSKDGKGKPLSGEVDLWLVDQAVLALGKEQALDPLDAFITPVDSAFIFHDTRSAVFGKLPLNEIPGGDGDGDGSNELLDRTTIRRKFSSVPYFRHAIKVGPDGKTSVKIKLPDNLTNFMVRAKAVSGADRFGFATGQIAVRLPLVVQPILPRFVRAEDRVQGGLLARVVEGSGGEATAAIRVEGAKLEKAAPTSLVLKNNTPSRLDYVFSAGTPRKKDSAQITITAAVERKADKARDGVESKLSILPDLEPSRSREIYTSDEAHPLMVNGLPTETRPGTVRRTILISDREALIRMASGLNFLLDYPYRSTENRLSRARAFLALEKFSEILHLEDQQKQTQRAVAEALEWLPQVVGDDGLAAHWPGSRGYVSLTAWAVELMTAAKTAGHPIDEKTYRRMQATLENALRSDYSQFIDGGSWSERVYALRALSTAGKYREGDTAELARKTNYLDLESTAIISRVLSQHGQATSSAVQQLQKKLWGGIVTRLHQGKEIYGGLQDSTRARPALIFPSETRTLAEISRALSASGDQDRRLELLYDALITLGRGDGWGSTNANTAALLALAERIQPGGVSSKTVVVTIHAGGKSQTFELGKKSPVLFFETEASGEIRISSESDRRLTARVEDEYVPITGGKKAEAVARGFVVTRELLRISDDGAAPEKLALSAAGNLSFRTGTAIEEHVTVTNVVDRTQVAVVVPLAAGVEPMNPNLQTAPPEAHPSGTLTAQPSYVEMLDDRVAYYYDELPKGTYHFYFRVKATTPGNYTQPPAFAELMTDRTVRGRSPGAAVEITAE
jgi:uncharacterized protein YfaS (alpha-2-macroglobulin family)